VQHREKIFVKIPLHEASAETFSLVYPQKTTMSFSLSLFEKRRKERLIERSITLHIYGVLSITQQTVCCRRILN